MELPVLADRDRWRAARGVRWRFPAGGGGEPADADEKVLHVYNWADYVAPSTVSDFVARTGIKVIYDFHDSSEVLQTRLLTGRSGYDVVVTSGGATRRLSDVGAIRKLDISGGTTGPGPDAGSIVA